MPIGDELHLGASPQRSVTAGNRNAPSAYPVYSEGGPSASDCKQSDGCRKTVVGRARRISIRKDMIRSSVVQISMWLVAVVASHWAATVTKAVDRIDFSRDIQPILADKCYHCHGPDAAKRKADLRLDTQAGALAPRKGKAAIVPGNLADSELVRRIGSTDPDEQMPPPKSGRTVSAAQIALLKNWVAAGASWGKHWAFVPPVRPKLPAVKDPAWCRNPIDAFILNRLESEGLARRPRQARKS